MNDRFRVMRRQPQRVSITISFRLHEVLLNRSEDEGRSMSNLCAVLLEESLLYETAPAEAAITCNSR